MALLFAAVERPLGALAVLGAGVLCVDSAAAGLTALAVCAARSLLWASAFLGLRAAVPRDAERLVAVLAVLLAWAVAAGAASA